MKKILIAVGSLLTFMLLLTFLFYVNKNNIIINTGVATFRNSIIIMLTISIIVFSIFVLFIILYARSLKSKDIFAETAMTESDRKALYAELQTFRNGKWSGLNCTASLVEQLNSMDEHQRSLQYLLEQTRYLKQRPTEIIQKVEDCMYVNIKKLLNYMHVIQKKKTAFMQSKINECCDKNNALLQKAEDFVIAVTEYVNRDLSPGEDLAAVDHVNSYMYVVLDAIEKQDIYLS